MSVAESKVTLKIPRPLYNRISHLIKESSFSSVTDFIVYILRDLFSSHRTRYQEKTRDENELSQEEITAIRKRLKSLGYF